MERLFLAPSQTRKIIINRNKLEKGLKVKLSFSKGEILIDGDAIDEYTAVRVINALSLNFEFKIALLLKQEDYMLEIVNIKDYLRNTSPRRLEDIRARIIGTRGKAMENIMQLSDCAIKLRGNSVAIIGKTECVETATSAIISLIKGSKHGNVYARLEKASHEELTKEDLGLKI